MKFIIASVIAGVLSVMPAGAGTAEVTLDISVGQPFATVPVAGPCDLGVAEGADGFDVLDAAVAAGCIGSYTATGSESDQFGRFLVCIDELCDPTGDGLVLYWRFGVDGAGASTGLDAHEVVDDQSLSLSFTTWFGCLADPSIC